MIIGVVKEIKKDENRVSLVPVGAEILTQKRHQIIVEKDAGQNSGFSDEEYSSSGAQTGLSAEEVFARADMILKVKEPLESEWELIRKDQIVFTYFHFAASRELTEAILLSGATAVAYETIETSDGKLPLLTPMSEVAGKMAVQQAAKYLEREHGGRGVLIGGVPGVEPATVMVLGAGVVGTNAAKVAAALGARVFVLDINVDRMRYLDDVMPSNVFTLMSNPANIRKFVKVSDIVIAGVLIHGGRAPKLITREMLKTMRKGAVMVDVAIDQGGSFETSRATTHKDPIYEVDGIIHYCVSNMPGAMPVTSTVALTNVTLPYIIRIADQGIEQAILKDSSIRHGVNLMKGKVVYQAVANAFDMEYTNIDSLIGDQG